MMAEAASSEKVSRSILRLAVPALGTLIAEPLFLIADSAIIGHLGVTPLAGVALAAALLQTGYGLMIFLAYSTTPAVARFLGAGQLAQALAMGRNALWLAIVLGLMLSLLGAVFGQPLLQAIGAQAEVLEYASIYWNISLLGIPALLLSLAATGVFRGLQDGRTPLVISIVSFPINAVLNWLFVYPLGLSVAGAAWGTVVVQWAMAVVFLSRLIPRIRAQGLSLLPDVAGLRALGVDGGWLFIRTASLRVALLATVILVTSQGPINLAAHHILFTIYTFFAFVLDAIAIAAQSLIGKELGAGNIVRVRELTNTMMWWGVGFGVITGIVLLIVTPWAGWVFTSDPQVHQALQVPLWLLALSQPVAGYVFVLDGVLMGAGDGRYLALAGVVCLIVYGLFLLWLLVSGVSGMAALAFLWLAFVGGYLVSRAVSLGARIRGTAWMHCSAEPARLG